MITIIKINNFQYVPTMKIVMTLIDAQKSRITSIVN